jgi:hypothetical protein
LLADGFFYLNLEAVCSNLLYLNTTLLMSTKQNNYILLSLLAQDIQLAVAPHYCAFSLAPAGHFIFFLII